MKVYFIPNEIGMFIHHFGTFFGYLPETVEVELPNKRGNFCMIKILGQNYLKHLIMAIDGYRIALMTPGDNPF